MARSVVWRTGARADITGNSATFTFADNILPIPRPGMSLVGLGFRLKGTTVDVADFDRIRIRTQRETIYDQTILHERLWQERYCYSKNGPTTLSGGTATTFLGSGGFVVWLNDQRALNRDVQDLMGTPLGEGISVELVTASTGPLAAATVDLVGIYSTVVPSLVGYRLETVLNIANGVTGGIRQLDFKGALLAYGIPNQSATGTLADCINRFQMRLRGNVIFDGDLGVAMLTELDEANWSYTDSIAEPGGTGMVLWKDTRGFALPGGPDSYAQIDTGSAAAATLASVEMPTWSAGPQGN